MFVLSLNVLTLVFALEPVEHPHGFIINLNKMSLNLHVGSFIGFVWMKSGIVGEFVGRSERNVPFLNLSLI